MYCPHCGTQMADARTLCPNCGRQIGPPPLPRKKGPPTWVWILVGCAAIPVLLGIVGIIAAIVIPNFLDATQKAKEKRAVHDLQAIGAAVEVYKAQHGSAPSAADIDALRTELGAAAASLPRVDPWQHPFRYGCWQEQSASSCDHYGIASGGRDGRFEQDDLSAYPPGEFAPHEFDHDIVFADGSLIVGPGAR